MKLKQVTSNYGIFMLKANLGIAFHLISRETDPEKLSELFNPCN